MPLVIGSEALALYDTTRESKDIDVVAYNSQVKSVYRYFGGSGRIAYRGMTTASFHSVTHNKKVEVFLADKSKAWQHILTRNSVGDVGMYYSNLKLLYAIKEAHIHIPRKYTTHIHDYGWLGNRLFWKNHYPVTTRLLRHEADKRYRKTRRYKDDKLAPPPDIFPRSAIAEFVGVDESSNLMSMAYNLRCKHVMGLATVIALYRRIVPFFFGSGPFFSSSEALQEGLVTICTDDRYANKEVQTFARRHFSDVMRYADTNFDSNFIIAYYEGKIPLDKPLQVGV